MTHFLLTPEQQLAVCNFSANTDATGDYSAPTLQQIVLEHAYGAGNWTAFMLALSESTAEVRRTAQAFFMAICGWTPETMWNKVSHDDGAMTSELTTQMESDDSCAYRETARFIQELSELGEADQQRLNTLLASVLPGFQLLTVAQTTLLPPIEALQSKIDATEA